MCAMARAGGTDVSPTFTMWTCGGLLCPVLSERRGMSHAVCHVWHFRKHACEQGMPRETETGGGGKRGMDGERSSLSKFQIFLFLRATGEITIESSDDTKS